MSFQFSGSSCCGSYGDCDASCGGSTSSGGWDLLFICRRTILPQIQHTFQPLSFFKLSQHTQDVVQLYWLPHFLATWLNADLVAAAKLIVELEDGTLSLIWDIIDDLSVKKFVLSITHDILLSFTVAAPAVLVEEGECLYNRDVSAYARMLINLSPPLLVKNLAL